MKHRRQLIRKTVIRLLKGKTDAKSRVYSNPTIPSPQERLPAILVFYESESIEEFNIAPRDFKRKLLLSVQIIDADKRDEKLQDNLDKIAGQVEEILGRDETLDGNAQDIVLQSVDFAFEKDGSRPIGAVKLIYEVTYIGEAPVAKFPDYKGSDIDYKIGHHKEPPDEIIDAEDELENEN